MGSKDDDQKSTKRKNSTKSADVSTKCSVAIASCASERDNFAQQPSTSSAMVLMDADQRRCSSISSSDSNTSIRSSFSSSSSRNSFPSDDDNNSDAEEVRRTSKKRGRKQRHVTATTDLNTYEYTPGAHNVGDLTGDAPRPGTARSMPTTSKRNTIFRLHNYSYGGAQSGPSSSALPVVQLPPSLPSSGDVFSPPHNQNYFLPGYGGSSGEGSDSGGAQLRRRPTDPSGGSASSTTVCFGLLMVHSTFITLFVFDFLLLSHSLIFTVTSYLNGEHRYNNEEAHVAAISSAKLTTMPSPFLVTPGDKSKLGNNEKAGVSDVSGITSVVPYELLLPLFALEVFWLISAVMALAALKFVQPLLQISYIVVSGLVIMTTIWLIVTNVSKFFYSTGRGQSAFHLPLALTISCANLIFFTQIYFLYIKIMCIRILFRKRKSVVSTNVSATTSSVMNLEAGGHSGGSGNRTSLMSAPLPTSVSSAVNVLNGKKDYVKRMTKASFEKAECDCCYGTDNVETYSTKSTIIITDDFR